MFCRLHRLNAPPFLLSFLMTFCIGFVLATLHLLSSAGVYKCTDKYGRISIGDQPCTANVVTPSEISTKPTTSTRAANTTKSQKPEQPNHEEAATLQATLEQRIQLKHNTECRDLRLQLKAQGHFAVSLLEPKQPLTENDKVPWESYRVKCLTQAKDIVVLEEAQREGARQEKLRKSNCENKAREYESRKQRASTLTESELAALAALQSEVARGCR